MLIFNFLSWEDNYIILLKCEFSCILGGYKKKILQYDYLFLHLLRKLKIDNMTITCIRVSSFRKMTVKKHDTCI